MSSGHGGGRLAGSIKSKHREMSREQSKQKKNDMSLLLFVVRPCGRATQLLIVSAAGAQREKDIVRWCVMPRQAERVDWNKSEKKREMQDDVIAPAAQPTVSSGSSL